jgi:hypothetical protein
LGKDQREGRRRLVTLARLRNIILWRFVKINMPDLYPTPYLILIQYRGNPSRDFLYMN